MTPRTDIHRPSEIIPADYQYVAVWTMNITGFGECEFILRERQICKEHMEHTGGALHHYSNGSCGICGNVQAIYLVLFHHAKSNEYIVAGIDCAQKLDMHVDSSAMKVFKRRCADAREQIAGKRKAIALLGDAGLIDAWEVFTADYPKHNACTITFTDYGEESGECSCGLRDRLKDYMAFPEATIRDIVGKLVKYGSVSEKQTAFIGKLLKQIADRPIVEAARKAERDAAGPVPVGRVEMQGEVVGVKQVEGMSFSRNADGVRTKLVIKLENGSVVFGARFANLDKGDKVHFVASVEASQNDPKFGFYKRPALYLTKEQKKALKILHRVSTHIWEQEGMWGVPEVNDLINQLSGGTQ